MKYALVTGATSGIGYEMAKILASKKHHLILASRNRKKLEEIKQNFEKEYSINVKVIVIDLSESNAAQMVFQETRNNEVDILINNSGFGNYGEHTEIEIEENNKLLQLNIVSLTEMCALFGAEMKKRKHGYILNIASTAAYQPTPYFAAYGASKSYVLNFSEALAKELEEYNVSVSCLSPGATKTDFFETAKINNTNNSQLKESSRTSPVIVAKIGIDAMFNKKLSVIPGIKNQIMAFSNRFAPRSLVATISKKIMKS